MPTREQSMANARTAARVIARSLGFYTNDGGGFVVASLSPANQVRLGDAVADYVAHHPALFDADAISAANYHLSLPFTGKPLADAGMSVEDFAVALLDESLTALNSVGGVGRGILSTFKLAEWVIPAAALIAAGIGLWALYRKSKKV